jgi:perosamine synthetase
MEPKPFTPLARPVLDGNERTYVDECVDTGWVVSGRFIGLLEDLVRTATGVDEVVACASGTAALHVALALAGVRPDDEVVVPSITFIAPVNAVRYIGARPVFIGCDGFMNLDPEILADFFQTECEQTPEGLRDRVTGRRVAAVVPVHVFGNPCDMAGILDLCRSHGVTVVEDACESIGSRWTGGPLAGRHTGAVGDLGAFSFNGNKIVTAAGGGAVVTDDEQTARRARYLIDQAKEDPRRYVHGSVGFNYRLSNVQAAIGAAQMEQLPRYLEIRQRNHERYVELLDGAPGLRLLGAPDDTAPNYWFYSLLVEPDEFGMDPNALMLHLEQAAIETRPLWPPNHLQSPYLNERRYRVERAEWFWRRVLNLPCSSDLTSSDVETVCAEILRVHGRGGHCG